MRVASATRSSAVAATTDMTATSSNTVSNAAPRSLGLRGSGTGCAFDDRLLDRAGRDQEAQGDRRFARPLQHHLHRTGEKVGLGRGPIVPPFALRIAKFQHDRFDI